MSFSAPSSDGGTPITGYTVTASPGGEQATDASAGPVTLTGLQDGTSYSFTVTANNVVGASPGAVTNQITTLKPTTTAVGTPSSSYYGTPVTLGAQVSSTYSGSPTGLVNFTTASGTSLGSATVGSGGATGNDPSVTLDAGTTVVASYGGDGAFESSSGRLTPTIQPAVTSVALSASPATSTPGAAVTVTAAVSNTSTSVVPFGTVTFSLNGSALTGPVQLNSSGDASVTISDAPSGTYTVAATYHDPKGDFVDSQRSLAISSAASTTGTATTTTSTCTDPTGSASCTVASPPPTVTETTPAVTETTPAVIETTPAVTETTSAVTVTVAAPAPVRTDAFALSKPSVMSGGRIKLTTRTEDSGRMTLTARVIGRRPALIYGSTSLQTRALTPATILIRPRAAALRVLRRASKGRLAITISFRATGAPSTATVSVDVTVTKPELH